MNLGFNGYNPYYQQQQYGQAFAPMYNNNNPYQQQTETNNSGIIWVHSQNEANNYLVAPNSAVALWDMNEPFVYLKQADASGKPIIKKYRLSEEVQGVSPAPSAVAEYALKSDIDELKKQIENLKQKCSKGDSKNG